MAANIKIIAANKLRRIKARIKNFLFCFIQFLFCNMHFCGLLYLENKYTYSMALEFFSQQFPAEHTLGVGHYYSGGKCLRL